MNCNFFKQYLNNLHPNKKYKSYQNCKFYNQIYKLKCNYSHYFSKLHKYYDHNPDTYYLNLNIFQQHNSHNSNQVHKFYNHRNIINRSHSPQMYRWHTKYYCINYNLIHLPSIQVHNYYKLPQYHRQYTPNYKIRYNFKKNYYKQHTLYGHITSTFLSYSQNIHLHNYHIFH